MYRTTKTFCIIVLVLAAGILTEAQRLKNDGLVLIGSVQSVKATDEKDRRQYKIVLRLAYRNDGEKTLIVPVPTYMTRKVEFLYQSMGSESMPPDDAEKAVSTFSLRPKIFDVADMDFDWMDGWVRQLDQSGPPPSWMIILKPGVTYEFMDTVDLEQKFELAGPSGRKVKVWEGFTDSGKAAQGIPLSDLPAFTVEYHIPFANYPQNPELLLTLRARWARYGKLVIDDNGGFTFKSERIMNSSGR